MFRKIVFVLIFGLMLGGLTACTAEERPNAEKVYRFAEYDGKKLADLAIGRGTEVVPDEYVAILREPLMKYWGKNDRSLRDDIPYDEDVKVVAREHTETLRSYEGLAFNNEGVAKKRVMRFADEPEYEEALGVKWEADEDYVETVAFDEDWPQGYVRYDDDCVSEADDPWDYVSQAAYGLQGYTNCIISAEHSPVGYTGRWTGHPRQGYVQGWSAANEIGYTNGGSSAPEVGYTDGNSDADEVGYTDDDSDADEVGYTDDDGEADEVGYTNGEEAVDVGYVTGDEGMHPGGYINGGIDQFHAAGYLDNDFETPSVGYLTGDEELADVGYLTGDEGVAPGGYLGDGETPSVGYINAGMTSPSGYLNGSENVAPSGYLGSGYSGVNPFAEPVGYL